MKLTANESVNLCIIKNIWIEAGGGGNLLINEGKRKGVFLQPRGLSGAERVGTERVGGRGEWEGFAGKEGNRRRWVPVQDPLFYFRRFPATAAAGKDST